MLKPWQVEGAAWLAPKRHALLADEMRVGKTLTAIEAARLTGARRTLVICPAIARYNWAENIREHLSVEPQIALRRADRPECDAVITSYDLAEATTTGIWDLVILDESHYLRRCDAGRTKFILGKGGLVHRAARVWFLSGTPAVNHYGELWQMLYVCGVCKLDYPAFVCKFCQGRWDPQRGFQITGSKNHEVLRAMMKDFMLRRKFKDIAPHLPAIEFTDYAVELPRDAHSLDSPELREALQAPDPMAALEAAAPAHASLRRLIGLAKVEQVTELVKARLETSNEKIVLFTYHRQVLEKLTQNLSAHGAVGIAGGMAPTVRNAVLRRFRHDPRCQVFVGQIVAAGTNIDLSSASIAYFVESSWVPGENAQAAMRLQNMNQTRKVSACFIGMTGSIDQHIQRVVRRKTRELNSLFG